MQNLRFILIVFCVCSFGVAVAAKKNDMLSAEKLIAVIAAERADDKRTDEQIIGELKELLKDIDVDAQNAAGWTALMAAAKKGSLVLVDYLVVNGADIEKKNTVGQTASDIDSANLFSDTAVSGYLTAVDQFKKGGWVALIFHNSAIVKFFLEQKKFDVNAKDNSGKTVLMYVVEKGGKDLVDFLVKHGANINAVDNDGKTALMLAAQDRNSELTAYLLGAGADPEVQDKTGKTALMNAIIAKIKKKFLPLDDSLLSIIQKSKKLDLPIPGQEGRTVLMVAAKYGWKHIVKSLLENGANVNAVDENGNTSLMYVARYAEKEMGPNIYKDMPDFVTTVDLLIEHHANLDVCNNSGQTALIEVSKNAISKKKTLVQAQLLEKGADPDIQDKDGKTALMWAAEEKLELGWLIRAVKNIVELGYADLDITDKKDKTALVIAQEAGNKEAADYLTNMQADSAYKQKVLERKRRKQEKKESELLLTGRKEQERLEKIATELAERRREEQLSLKKLVEALKALS